MTSALIELTYYFLYSTLSSKDCNLVWPLLNLIQHQEIFSDNSGTFQRSEESGVI